MKRFIIISQWAFACAGLTLFLLPKDYLPDYYKPIPMGLAAIGYSFLIALPAWVFRELRDRRELLQFQTALATGMALNGIGSLGAWGLYKYGFDYDKLVHFVFPALMVYFGARLLRIRSGKPVITMALLTAVIVMASGVAWEYIEYFFASYFHFGFFGTLFDPDSIRDLLANMAGVIAALIYLISYPD